MRTKKTVMAAAVLTILGALLSACSQPATSTAEDAVASSAVEPGWNEFIPGVLIGLVFFPPAFYRRWVERRASDGDEPLPE